MAIAHNFLSYIHDKRFASYAELAIGRNLVTVSEKVRAGNIVHRELRPGRGWIASLVGILVPQRCTSALRGGSYSRLTTHALPSEFGQFHPGCRLELVVLLRQM